MIQLATSEMKNEEDCFNEKTQELKESFWCVSSYDWHYGILFT